MNVLNEWFQENAENTYPSKQEKRDLAQIANLTVPQVSQWFINQRRRKIRIQNKMIQKTEPLNPVKSEEKEILLNDFNEVMTDPGIVETCSLDQLTDLPEFKNVAEFVSVKQEPDCLIIDDSNNFSIEN